MALLFSRFASRSLCSLYSLSSVGHPSQHSCTKGKPSTIMSRTMSLHWFHFRRSVKIRHFPLFGALLPLVPFSTLSCWQTAQMRPSRPVVWPVYCLHKSISGTRYTLPSFDAFIPIFRLFSYETLPLPQREQLTSIITFAEVRLITGLFLIHLIELLSIFSLCGIW